MERLNYAPEEVREALRYAAQQGDYLLRANAANWRRNFKQFVDAMTQQQEALRLLARILEGHTRIDGKKWYAQAANKQPPPLPEDRYGRLALVWKLLVLVTAKTGADFSVEAAVDLPYVISYAFPGYSLGEKFEEFRLRYLEPFVVELRALADAVVAKLPPGGEKVDLWDAALAALTGEGEGPPPAAAGPGEGDGEAVAAPRARRRPAKKVAGTKKATAKAKPKNAGVTGGSKAKTKKRMRGPRS